MNEVAFVTEDRDEVEEKELLERINAQLPAEYRRNYLRMLAGESVSRERREAVRRAVADILRGHQVDPQEPYQGEQEVVPAMGL